MGLGCRKSFPDKQQRPMNPIERFLKMQPGKALQNDFIAQLNFEINLSRFVKRTFMRQLDGLWLNVLILPT